MLAVFKAAADSTQNKTPAASKSAPAKAAKEIDVTVLKKRQERFGAVNPEIAKVVTNGELGNWPRVFRVFLTPYLYRTKPKKRKSARGVWKSLVRKSR